MSSLQRFWRHRRFGRLLPGCPGRLQHGSVPRRRKRRFATGGTSDGGCYRNMTVPLGKDELASSFVAGALVNGRTTAGSCLDAGISFQDVVTAKATRLDELAICGRADPVRFRTIRRIDDPSSSSVSNHRNGSTRGRIKGLPCLPGRQPCAPFACHCPRALSEAGLVASRQACLLSGSAGGAMISVPQTIHVSRSIWMASSPFKNSETPYAQNRRCPR